MSQVTSRTLVVDNYDSFTYNLVHYLRDITNRDPLVLKKDDTYFAYSIGDRDLCEVFDLIVLSPGPGNPETDSGCLTNWILSKYFGSSVTRGRLPVLLGVCMGYEEIAFRLGIPSVRGLPRHGIRWPIRIDHAADENSIFAGLPDLIHQVRYHSLVLCPKGLELSHDLVVTATALDKDPSLLIPQARLEGPLNDPIKTEEWNNDLSLLALAQGSDKPSQEIEIPMAFRHKTLPVYGVQFHPESIMSDFGKEILRNACKLANIQTTRALDHSPIRELPAAPVMRICSTFRRIFQLDKNCLADYLFRIFSKIFFSKNNPSVWLDCPPGSTGRWSFMSCGGSLYAQHSKGISLESGQDLGIPAGIGVSDFFPHVDKYLSTFSVCSQESSSLDLPPMRVPCMFTCLGYEALRDRDQPDASPKSLFIISHRVLALDNETGNVFALFVENDDLWATELEETIPAALKEDHVMPPEMATEIPEFCIRDSKSCYMEEIRTCQAAIERGESYELCLTTTVLGSVPRDSFDPLRTYSILREKNPAQYAAFIHVPTLGVSILSASPERFLKVDGSTGTAEVKPIKGTRPRGETAEEDERIRTELANSSKDRAENLMIVDLVRNDLSRVCHDVHCPVLMNVETYKPYHQLVSTVRGTVDAPLFKVLEALFPAGSMTGAPKTRSISLLEAIEGAPRGLGYSGALGYVSPLTKSVDLSVVIRTILAKENSGKVDISLGAGGAILSLSNPTDEWREMLLKARKNLSVLAAGLGSRGVCLRFGDKSESLFVRSCEENPTKSIFTTMRYEPGRGIWLFDRHLKRIGLSRATVLHAITDAVSRFEPSSRQITPLSEGPFIGIADLEWFDCDLGSNAARIRLELNLEGEISCTLSDLVYENPSTVILNRVRVDSADVSLRIKSSDWFVPETQSDRERALLATELDLVTETGIANVAAMQGHQWITPGSSSVCLLAGTLRSMLLDRRLMHVGDLTIEATRSSHLVCFNSVRGVFTVRLV